MKRRKHHSTKALQPLHWAGIGLVNQNPASATKTPEKAPVDGAFLVQSGAEFLIPVAAILVPIFFSFKNPPMLPHRGT